MKRSIALLAVLGSAFGASAQVFGPARSEFRLNTYTTNDQTNPAIAYSGPNAFLVVWQGDGLGDPDLGIHAQRYSGPYGPFGSELLVNTYTTLDQTYPRVAGPPGGSPPGFVVVVWQSEGEDGAQSGVFGQRYENQFPVDPPFQVNTYTTGAEEFPDVAQDGNGNFVVVWEQPDSDGYGIFARRYSSAGAPLTSPFRVNTYTTSLQSHPSVAASLDGSFVVVWQSHKEFGTSDDVVGQRYASAGEPLGGVFRIEVSTAEYHGPPSVAAVGTNAGFVVAWDAMPDVTTEIYARRYDAAGAPLTSPFRVNTFTTNPQVSPSVAGDPDGHFTIVWVSEAEDGDAAGVFGQRYGASGAPLGGEFRVNTYTTGRQINPRVAMVSNNGEFTVVWASASQDGSGYGVFGRQFCGLAGDADGNGKIDVADVFYLINSLFAGGPLPVEFSDVNFDGKVDVQDVFYLINYLFARGPAPACVG